MASLQDGIIDTMKNKAETAVSSANMVLDKGIKSGKGIIKAVDLTGRAAIGVGRAVEAIYAFIDDKNAEHMAELLKNNKASIMEVSFEDKDRFLDFIGNSDLTYTSVDTDMGNGPKTLIIIPNNEKEYANELKTIYGLSTHLICAAPDLETMKKFGELDPAGLKNLSSTEADVMRENMKSVGIMYNIERNSEGNFDITFLKEDRPFIDILKAGLEQLKENNSEYFEHMDKIREEKDKIISEIMASPSESYVVSYGNTFLAVDKDSMSIIRAGKTPQSIEKNSPMYSKKLQEEIMKMGSPSFVRGKEAKEMVKDLKQQDEIMPLYQALEKLNVKNLKEFEKKRSAIQKKIDNKSTPEMMEALYRAKVALDVVHARQDATPEVAKNLKDQYTAEADARRAVGICLCGGQRGAIGSFVSMEDIDGYVRGETSEEKIKEYEEKAKEMEKEERQEREPYLISREEIRFAAFMTRDWFENDVLTRDEVSRDELVQEEEIL